MNLRFLGLGLGAILLVSLASVGAMVLFINPYTAGAAGLALFSAAALMFFFGLFSWLGLRLRRRFIGEKNLDRVLKMVLREGALVAALGLGYLWLAHFKLFKIWTAIPLAAIILGVEYYFLTANYKSEARNSKFETNSNHQNHKSQTV